MGSGPVGGDDLWYHHREIFSIFVFVFFVLRPPQGLPPGSEAPSASFGALQADSKALPVGSETLPAGFRAHPG